MKKYTDDDEELHVLSDLLRYCDHNRDADRSFVDNVYDFYDRTGFITESQLKYLKSIHYQLSVDDFITILHGN